MISNEDPGKVAGCIPLSLLNKLQKGFSFVSEYFPKYVFDHYSYIYKIKTRATHNHKHNKQKINY